MPASRSNTCLDGTLADDALVLGQLGERLLVGDRAPQPGRDGLFLDLLQARRHAGLAEILLRQNVGGHLRPELRHLDVLGAGTPPSRPDCGSRSWSGGTRCPRRETGRPWCSAVRSALFLAPCCAPGRSERRRHFIPGQGLTPAVFSVFDASLTYEPAPVIGTGWPAANGSFPADQGDENPCPARAEIRAEDRR